MPCSSIHLQNDMAIWFNPQIYDSLTHSYRNLSQGATYDCGLTSVPCASNITKELTFSDSTFVYWFDLITINVVLTALSLVGIVGNVINILIIATKNIANDSTNAIFLWLSVSDLLCSLSCAIVVAICFLCYVDGSLALSAFNMSFPYVLDSIKRFSLLSLDFVMLISIQRAVAVILPFKVSRIFTNKTTKIIIGSLIVIFILTQIPARVGYYPRWVFHPHFNKEISLGYSYRIDFRVLFDYVGIYFYSRSAFDLLIIIVTISATIIKLSIHGKQRLMLKGSSGGSGTTSASSTKTKTENQSTKMSVQEVKVIKMSTTVCVITFVIYSFNMMNTAVIQIYADKLYKTPIPPATTNGGMILAAFGASFNFFLYLTMSSQYKERFNQMFRIGKLEK